MPKISETCFAVVDVESTGLDPAKDRIVEFACRDTDGFEIDFLVNPGIPIPPEASGTHHITDIHVQDAMTHEVALDRIERIIPPSSILVAHNAAFDRSFLPALQDRKWLCTQRLAQHLAPLMPNFKNQTLRYALLKGLNQFELEKKMQGLVPHRAKADVLVTSHVLQHLLAQYLRDGYEDDVDALLEYAASPIRVLKFTFGKFSGKCISDVARIEPGYLRWMLNDAKDIDADLRWTLEQTLKERAS